MRVDIKVRCMNPRYGWIYILDYQATLNAEVARTYQILAFNFDKTCSPAGG